MYIYSTIIMMVVVATETLTTMDDKNGDGGDYYTFLYGLFLFVDI